MFDPLKKFFTKATKKVDEIPQAPTAPQPVQNSDIPTVPTGAAEAEVAVEVQAQAETAIESKPHAEAKPVSPPPLPTVCESKEIDLYEPSEKEAKFADWLEDRIIGQPKAIKALVTAYRAYLNPIRNPNRPISTLMFLGPSRTGKTLCAQRLAEYFHGTRDAFIKVDGGDYMDKANLTKLFGASAQWIGYQKPDQKTPDDVMDTSALLSAHNLIASRKGSSTNVTVILIDEIEKGCPEFIQFFLAILDVGYATMGNNQKVDYGQCIFIMTSNLGMDRIEKEMSAPIGIGATQQEILSDVRIAALVERCMKERFSPEFRNRIDASVIFSHLTNESIKKIVGVEIGDLEQQLYKSLGEKKFELEIDTQARDFLLAQALQGKGNVANLKRVLETHLKGPLGTGLINDVIGAGQKVSATYKGTDRLSFSISNSASTDAPQKEQPPLQYLEAEKLWTQARKDSDANLTDLAISNMRKAIETLEPLASTQGLRMAWLYNLLGLYYDKKADRIQEAAAYTKALGYRLKVKTTDDLIDAETIFGNLGICYIWAGEKDKATAVFEQGLAYAKQQEHTSEYLGYFLWRYAQLDVSKARDLFDFAIKKSKSS
jgi:tetratricopeptide (TPR) repeat protein/DNA polymerase III delta prime subunit